LIAVQQGQASRLEPKPESLGHDRELLLQMYRGMVRIRRFEESAITLHKRGKLKASVHPYVGQEASGVGICMALGEKDWIVGTHRSHGHMLAKGADPRSLLAEIWGKETGCCKGRGGSMHVTDLGVGGLGGLAVVGAGLPIAAGLGLAFKMLDCDRVAVCFFGDGASNTGNFHESLNMASIWNLPVVFALENNCWAVSTPVERAVKNTDLSMRAMSYGIPGVRVDGNDVLAVYEAAQTAVARARSGAGPTLLVTDTYRVEGHYAGEPQVYRPRSEVDSWRAPSRDPIWRFRELLVDRNVAAEEELDGIDEKMRAEIETALQFAASSPEPAPASCMDYIWA
jgi:TPP-dependent pyruvate/acetoin dehydrogenase alpha subunit